MRMYRTGVVMVMMGCFTLFTSCTKDNSTRPTGNSGMAQAPATPSQQKLLDLVNDVRSKGCNCGNTAYPPVGSVTWNTKLEQAAKKHSDYMNSSGNFSHTGANGTNAGQRITTEGYMWMSYGENIAAGYATEEAVIKGWLESEGHCKNIMNGKFKEMGVATGGSYWTQVFAAHQ